ncbi:hypothetical protein Taro_004193 [Colocasia esculenta]|uniref:Uncharacterized protein n=1 Tax=Colocasia esculenta TaxID=4460 RepID=A0A843TR02_COLES|nr:hypothetical protein [Colocasia esculenta]
MARVRPVQGVSRVGNGCREWARAGGGEAGESHRGCRNSHVGARNFKGVAATPGFTVGSSTSAPPATALRPPRAPFGISRGSAAIARDSGDRPRLPSTAPASALVAQSVLSRKKMVEVETASMPTHSYSQAEETSAIPACGADMDATISKADITGAGTNLQPVGSIGAGRLKSNFVSGVLLVQKPIVFLNGEETDLWKMYKFTAVEALKP